MTTKNWQQLAAALVVLIVLAIVWQIGQLVLPSLKTMAPVLSWTILIAAEIIVISFAIGVPAFIFVHVRNHSRKSEASLIEARKLHVTDRGYIQGYVTSSPKERILVPQIAMHSPEVPHSVHIEEDSSSRSGNPVQDARMILAAAKDLLAGKYEDQRALPAPSLALPEAPPFRQVMPYIRDDQVVLGFGSTGAVLGKVLDWLSTLIVGRPGNGKSTGLYFFIAQLMMLKARFQVLDPHGTLLPLKEMLPYVNRNDGCIRMAPVIEQELEDRMTRYEQNGSQCLDPHYMLIVDELPSIADREQQLTKNMDRREKANFRSLIDVIRRVVCEGRKYQMYCMVVGQSIPASILPTIARDNMSTRYVFYCSADHARMAGLDRESIETYLPYLQGAVGKCIIAPARMQPFLGAIPFTEEDDLRYVIESTGYVRDGYDDFAGNGDTTIIDTLPGLAEQRYGNTGSLGNVYPFPPVNGNQTAFPGNGNTETALPEGVTEFMLKQIKGMYEANWPLRDIAGMVKLSGRNYWKFKAACEYLGIAQKQEA